MCTEPVERGDGVHVGHGARVHKHSCLTDYIHDAFPEEFATDAEDDIAAAALAEGWEVDVCIMVRDRHGAEVYCDWLPDEVGWGALAVAYQAAKFIERHKEAS